MNKAYLSFLLAMVCLLMSCGTADQSSSSKGSAQTTTMSETGSEPKAQRDTIQVAAKDNFFEPESITIQKGQTVIWTNEGSNGHSVTSGSQCSGDGTFDSWISPGESFSYTFEQTGEFPYFCIPHCTLGMTGTVVVEE